MIGALISVHSLGQLGFIALIPGATHLDSFLSPHSFACLGFPVPMLEVMTLGFMPFLRSFCCTDFFLLLCTLSRLGLPVLVSELSMPGLSSLTKSSTYPEPRLSVHARTFMESLVFISDYAEMPPESLQAMGRLESSLLVSGLSRFDSFLSVFDFLHLEPLALLRGVAQFSRSLPVLKLSDPGVSSLIRNIIWLGFPLPVLGKFTQREGVWNIGKALSALGTATIGLAFSACSAVDLEGPFSAFDFARLDSSLPMRTPGCVEFVLSTLGMCRVGLPTSLLDTMVLGSAVLFRNPAQPALFMSALGLSCFGASTFAVDFGLLGSALPARKHVQVEPILSACSSVTLDFLLFILDFLGLGFPPTPHSSVHVDLPVLTLWATHSGLPMFLQAAAYIDFLLLLSGVARPASMASSCELVKMGILSTSKAFGQLDLSLLLVGSACADSLLPAFDFLYLEFLIFVHSFVHLDFRLLLCGISCLGSPTSISGLTMGSFFPLHSFARSEAFTLSLDTAVVESSLFARTLSRIGLSPSLLGRAWMGASLLGMAEVQSDFLPSIHGFAHLDSLVVVLKVLDSESTPFLRAFCCGGLLASVLSTTRIDPSFLMLDCSKFESFLLIRGSACSGPFVFVLQFALLGLLALAQNFGWSASRLSAFGTNALESSLSVLDSLHSDSSAPLQTLA